MWEMPFYDIMLLYNAYSDYVNKENEQQQEQQAQYEQQYAEQREAMNMNNMRNNFKVPDMSSVTRGIMNGSNFKFPKI